MNNILYLFSYAYILDMNNLLKMHLTVFMWGFTGVFGELITISAFPLVWFRIFLSTVFILFFSIIIRKSLFISIKDIINLLFIGLILAIHWLCFYYAIKTSTVGLAVVCLSAQTLFTALLEPLLFNTKISKKDIIIGFFIIIGMIIIFNFEYMYYYSILTGLLAALLASLYTILNVTQIKKNNSFIICFYEMLGGTIGLTIILMLLNMLANINFLNYSTLDIIYLLLLSVLFTAMPQIVSIHVMNELTPYTVMLLSSLEPIYSILIALIILGSKEQMSYGFYLGSFIIIISIFLYPFINKK
ncbi:MAG: DMT family transporter [Bacteroides sp.]|nr:MAG: DMT family transporter [Bacteroides sp.]